MPKIIENLRAQLLEEARKQVALQGYTGTTIRSVASACGVGVGTVYNYFPSKEMLIATFMAEDWQQQLDAMAALPTDRADTLLRGVYEGLCSYAERYRGIFSDSGAVKAMSLGFVPRHQLLREQLASFIRPVCTGEESAFTAAFIAEALITWAMEGVGFDALYPVIRKLIQ